MCEASFSPQGGAGGMELCSQSKQNLASRTVQNVPSLGEGRRSAFLSPERTTLMKTNGHQCVGLLCARLSCALSSASLRWGESPLVPAPRSCGRQPAFWRCLWAFQKRYSSAAPTSSCWAGDMLSFSTVANLEPTERNVGLHCKEAGQVLDASPSKLEIFLFSWSRIELFPPVDTRCLSML